MIILLSYLWFLCWSVDGADKLMFASLSTFEIGCELTGIVMYLLTEKPWKRS